MDQVTIPGEPHPQQSYALPVVTSNRVLIADDDATTRRKLEGLLSKLGYEVVVTRNGTEAWECLQRDDAPALAILDWMMPVMSGVDICRQLRSSSARPYIYVIILTARDEPPDLIKAMEAGADDYLSKPFDAEELRVRLWAGKRVLALMGELQTKATHDDLTTLLNRAGILEVARRELSRTLRQRLPMAIVLADVDRFKGVNDAYGHHVGDDVLKAAGQRFGAQLRSYDALGRYGGEEFLAVLPGCDAPTAARVAERMRSALSDVSVEAGGHRVPVTASFGVAVADKGGEFRLDALIDAADDALYRAKRLGRNRVEVDERPSGARHTDDPRSTA